MTRNDIESFRSNLLALAERVSRTASSAEEEAYQATGGESGGDLSNTPMHLGDIASAVAAQELGATLLENERNLQREIEAALTRIEKGTFGRCEECGESIAHARLVALPYARCCSDCAVARPVSRPVNLDKGRPKSWRHLEPVIDLMCAQLAC